jgi:hypothetical protein
MSDRRFAILVGLLSIGTVTAAFWVILEPPGMVGNLAAEASGAFFGAGLIELLLLLEDRRRARAQTMARSGALAVSVSRDGSGRSALLHLENTSDERVSGIVIDLAVIGAPIPSEFHWRRVDEEDFSLAPLSRWRNFVTDQPSFSLLSGRQVDLEFGFVLRHGEGAGGIRATDMETTTFINIHWQFGGDPHDYSTTQTTKLANELRVAH